MTDITLCEYIILYLANKSVTGLLIYSQLFTIQKITLWWTYLYLNFIIYLWLLQLDFYTCDCRIKGKQILKDEILKN